MMGIHNRRRVLAAAVLTACLLCCGCGTQHSSAGSGETDIGQQSAQRDVMAMDTYLSFTAYGERAEEALDEAERETQTLDDLLSTGIDSSEISLANDGSTVLLSEDTAELIAAALELTESTQGAFDITMYPLLEEWGFPTQEYQVPSDKKIQTLLKAVGTDHLHFDVKNRTLSLDEGTEIDLGGIAKGYLGDKLRNIMKEQDVSSAMLSLGSSTIVLVGSKPDGSDWNIAVQNPDNTAEYVGVLAVSDCVADTSGGYERYFEQDGKTYWHILDPSTGKPAQNGLTSVTIVTQDGTRGDALSTALFVLGKEQAIAYWKQHEEEFNAVLIEEDGTITITDGLQDCFTSEHAFEVVS